MGRLGFEDFLFLAVIIYIIWYFTKAKSKRKEENSVIEFDRAIKNSEKMISHNVTKAKKYVEKKISLSYLTGCNWVLQNNDSNILYTFRNNGELLITINGIVEKCSYELIIDNNSILITKGDITELYYITNVQNDLLYINRVSNNEILMFLNQTKFKDAVKKIFLNN
ncbi:hypothetical protein [Flavobacterium sp. TSSA_36]|uniref:hypothetical protein n=1 Tax=Flavobacterium sp. TSSA_36 TaxID=3447669 RepID=UPI003F2D7AAC